MKNAMISPQAPTPNHLGFPGRASIAADRGGGKAEMGHHVMVEGVVDEGTVWCVQRCLCWMVFHGFHLYNWYVGCWDQFRSICRYVNLRNGMVQFKLYRRTHSWNWKWYCHIPGLGTATAIFLAGDMQTLAKICKLQPFRVVAISI